MVNYCFFLSHPHFMGIPHVDGNAKNRPFRLHRFHSAPRSRWRIRNFTL